MKNLILTPAILLALFPLSASAESLTVYFSGEVTSTAKNTVAITEVQIGDRVTGQYTFEASAADERPADDSSGLYTAESLSLTVAGYSYSASDNSISVSDDIAFIQGLAAMDAYEIVTPLREVSGPSLSGQPIAQIDLVLVDTDATVFSDDSLPTSLDLDDFEITSEEPYGTTGGRISFQAAATPGTIGEIRFKITSMSFQASENSVYYPHVAAKLPWKTEIGLINTSSSGRLRGAFNAYSNSGQLISSLPVSLAPHARREIDVSQDFFNPDDIGYLTLDANATGTFGYTKFYIDGKYRVALPASAATNTGDIYVSHIASNANWWTGLSLFNTTSSAKTLTIVFDDGTTMNRDIAGYEHQAFTIASLFGGTVQSGIKSAVIRNGSGIVGLELFGSTGSSGNNYLSGIALQDDNATTLYYPHAVNNATWWTGIVAYNPAATSTTLTIVPYAKNGEVLQAGQRVLAAGGKFIGTVSSLNLPGETAWFRITSTSPVTGFELFGTNNGRQLGGFSTVGLQRKNGIFAKLEKNGWTGIVLVNTQGNPAVVTLKAYSDSGEEVTTEVIDLASYEKLVGLPADIFTADISSATYLSFSSENEVVGFQLNGSADNMFLDALPGL